MSVSDETKMIRVASLGWMIQRVAGQLNVAMELRLAPHDLNLQQFAVMMCVLETDGLSQREIGQRFLMPAYAISRAIDHLEAAGLLERRAHPTSRRTYTIHATEQGVTLSEDLFAIVRDANDELAMPLTQEEREVFGGILRKLV